MRQSSRGAGFLVYMMVEDLIRRLNVVTGLKYRLPTEEEWEYAAQGGRHNQGNRYAGSNSLDDVAWFTSEKNTIYLSVLFDRIKENMYFCNANQGILYGNNDKGTGAAAIA